LGPAVAGLGGGEDPRNDAWYPRHADDLREVVDGYLAEAKSEPLDNLRALICPHAGYKYSGATAAIGYKQLAGRNIRTVVLLGPTHTTADLEGGAVATADAMESPLGQVAISPKAAELARLKPFAPEAPSKNVRRPGWWRASPKPLPAFGEETPFTWEHSVEVHLPFLQRTLEKFEVVPVVCGDMDPEAAAQSLLKILDDETLLVASSDLTHYLPYHVANSLDKIGTMAICSGNPEWFDEEDAALQAHRQSLACGKNPILVLMHVAREKGWKAKLLDYRNSGDTGGKEHRDMGVVGYAAIAFYQPNGAAQAPAKSAAGQAEFSAEDRKSLLTLARRTITAAAAGEKLPEPDSVPLSEKCSETRACFVTLKIKGRLRGCIGGVFPRSPLNQAVIKAAYGAALEDHRFTPVKSEEVGQIHVEVSVLTLPQQLKSKSPEDLLAKLRPGIDGVVLRVGVKQGLFLPQVWEQIPDKEQFLGEIAEQKAQLPRLAWKRPEAKILVFQVEAFEEKE
jgi:AmmeMemoRadiSam system protein A